MAHQKIVQQFKHGDVTVKIRQDQYPDSPREWDNLGTMLCAHGQYELGDKWPDHLQSFSKSRLQYLLKRILKTEGPIISSTLWLYDHSGLRIAAGPENPFTCPWDSGCVGLIYVPLKKVREEWGMKRVSAKLKRQVIHNLLVEVETYDDYLNDNVYGYILENFKGDHLDSCWGFYGLDHCISQAKESAEHFGTPSLLEGVEA